MAGVRDWVVALYELSGMTPPRYIVIASDLVEARYCLGVVPLIHAQRIGLRHPPSNTRLLDRCPTRLLDSVRAQMPPPRRETFPVAPQISAVTAMIERLTLSASTALGEAVSSEIDDALARVDDDSEEPSEELSSSDPGSSDQWVDVLGDSGDAIRRLDARLEAMRARRLAFDLTMAEAAPLVSLISRHVRSMWLRSGFVVLVETTHTRPGHYI